MFDHGYESEAKRIAVSLRVLFHHTAPEGPMNQPDSSRKRHGRKPSHSLLKQLGLRDSLEWVTTAGIADTTNLALSLGLINIEMSNQGARYHVPLDNRPPAEIETSAGTVRRGDRIPFKSWWTDPVMLDPAKTTRYSREDFVLALSNQEGGAHVDPQVQESYDKLANNTSLGFGYIEGEGPEIRGSNPVLSSVRQISYEVLESFSQQMQLIKEMTIST